MFLKFTKKYIIQIQDFSQPAQTPQMSEKFMTRDTTMPIYLETP